MLADEYQSKIEAIIGNDYNYEGANEQISRWIDEGIIEEPEGSQNPYFKFAWTIFLDEPEFVSPIEDIPLDFNGGSCYVLPPATEPIPWDPNADFNDQDFFWNVIDLVWGCLELPNGRTKRIWQQDLAVIVDLYELENNGIPRQYHEAWRNYYYNVGGDPGITVKWSAVKNFVKNPDDYGFDDDCRGCVDFGCEPYLYDVDIIFADGSSLHYDDEFIKR